MCGICGKLIFGDAIPERSQIAAMCATLIHRGPDAEGIYTAPHIGLGQRRLSIIDLSPEAAAPLANEDQTIWIVFNGEIYNFQELRGGLIERGHHFRTRTDTEVIVHLYEEYGVQCLGKMRGMFALAIWDGRCERLFTARDRLGKKPFYFAKTERSFIFGSEIKAITTDRDVSVSPNYCAIDQYLSYQFVPSPLTAFNSIHRLGPGQYLTCDLKGNITIEHYWSPPAPLKTTLLPDEIESEILRRLRESVRMRMISDVPLGAFLSGGIDSGTVVALMAQESVRPVKTFSIGFEDTEANELPYARLLAERYGTEHHEIIVKPDAADTIHTLVRHYNEPFADSSALPTYHVSKMTRGFVKVALSGDGGDESFAGYDHYGAILRWNKVDSWPNWGRSLVSKIGEPLLGLFPLSNRAARLRRGLAMLRANNIKERRLLYETMVKPEEKRVAYTPEFLGLISTPPVAKDPLAEFGWEEGMDGLDWLMRHDQNYYLPDCLMVKTDIASMANGLEVRCPFLDHELVEFAATIPSSLKRNSMEGKIILKTAIGSLLPEEILRKKKTGFSLPLAKWFRTDLAEMLSAFLLDDRAAKRGLFHPSFFRKLVHEHSEGKRDWSNRLWAFLFLELWFREFID